MPLVLSQSSASSGQIVQYSLLLVLWGLSIALAYWDLKRQMLPRAERLAWLAAVALLPGLGLAAYLLFRLFGRAFPLGAGGAHGAAGKRRVTELRQAPAGAPGRTGTILAADLVQETIADRRAALRPQVLRWRWWPAHIPASNSRWRCCRPAWAAAPRPPCGWIAIWACPRQHAEIYRQEGVLRLRDLDSSHGVMVNGLRIHDQALVAGDKIELGLSALVVKEAAA